MTLGQALAAKVQLIVWCKSCGHQVEPNISVTLARYGEGVTVIDWVERFPCSPGGGREVDFGISGVAR